MRAWVTAGLAVGLLAGCHGEAGPVAMSAAVRWPEGYLTHTARVMAGDGREWVELDGRAGPPFEAVAPDSLRPVLDAKDLSYVAWVAGRQRLIVNGAAVSPAFDMIRSGDRVFRSRSVWACAAQRGGRWVVASNQGIGPPLDELPQWSLWQMSDQRLFYYARQGDRWYAFANHRRWPYCAARIVGTPFASRDGRQIGYIARAGKRQCVVLDGRVSGWWDELSTPTLSPTGGRSAWRARRDGKYLMVVDGRAQPAYDAIAVPPRFSPDGRHLAYNAQRDGRWCIVIDGLARRWGSSVGPAYYSGDSRHFVYTVSDGGLDRCFVDDREVAVYHEIGSYTPRLSHDGSHYALVARTPRGFVVVFDGREEPAWSVARILDLSRDGRSLTYEAQASIGELFRRTVEAPPVAVVPAARTAAG